MNNTLKSVAMGTIVTGTILAICVATNILDQRAGLHTNDSARMAMMFIALAVAIHYTTKKTKVVKA